jgi:hypothetical protein
MITIILQFEVSCFIEWKRIYNSNEALRTQNNIVTKDIFVSLENFDWVTCIVEAPTIKDFYHQPQVIDELLKSAIISQPKVTYCHKINAL